MECAYDFSKLVNCTNTLNHLAAIDYRNNGMKFGCVYDKMNNVWTDLHPLLEGQKVADLHDFFNIFTNEDVIVVL